MGERLFIGGDMHYVSGTAKSAPTTISAGEGSVAGVIVGNLHPTYDLLVSFDGGTNFYTLSPNQPRLRINAIARNLVLKTNYGLVPFFVGLDSKSKTGLDVILPTAPGLLVDFDFSAPLTSWKAGFSGFGSAYADEQWNMQSYSGGYSNSGLTGSDTLTSTGGGLTGQSAVGIWDGSAYSADESYERDGSTATQYLAAGSGTTLDSDTSDFSGRIVFRSVGSTTVAFQEIVTKLLAATGGYRVRFNSTGTAGPSFQVHDGTNYFSVSGSGTFNDGAWHYLAWFWDVSAETIYFKSDQFAEASASTSTRTSGFANTGTTIKLAASQFGLGPIQIRHFSGSVGANASSHYAEDFWQHAQDPSSLLTTTSRNSLISVPLSGATVGHFSGGTALGATQLPIGYHGAFSDANKLGLYCNSAVTNILPYSETIQTGWGVSNCSRAADQGDSPDGFRTADTFTTTNINGFIYEDVVPSASTQYTFSLWIKRNGGSDVDGEIELYDITNAASMGIQTFTATDTWQRISVTGTTGVGSVSMRALVKIYANAESCFVWGMQAELGDGATAYIRTNGASAALVFSDYRSTLAPLESLAGEVLSTYIQNQTDDFYLWYPKSGGALTNMVTSYHLADLRCRPYWVNNIGGAEDTFNSSNSIVKSTEAVLRYLWNAAAGGVEGYEQVIVLNGTRTNGGSSPIDVGIDDVTCDEFTIGATAGAGTFAMDGPVQSIKIYDAPGAL